MTIMSLGFKGLAGNEDWAQMRTRMVKTQIAARGIQDHRVLAAMEKVPRHLFVPKASQGLAYTDQPLSLSHGQTISQPYIVALMSSLASVQSGDRILEIGTGSGYQAAVLVEMGAEVFSIEIVKPLAEEARDRLERLGYHCHVRAGDGWLGWPEASPFDAILITASTPVVPPKLKAQLAPGGRIILPQEVEGGQVLVLYTKGLDKDSALKKTDIIPVRFVPLTGEARKTPGIR